MTSNKISRYLLYTILAIAPVILFFLIFYSPARNVYDENNFYYNVRLIRDLRVPFKFLRGLKNQSPGPLYQIIYYPFVRYHMESIVAYRMVNFGLLCGCVLFLFRFIIAEGTQQPLAKAMLLFAIPLTWTTGGMALTEIPTIFFALASCYLLRQSLRANVRYTLLLSILSGLLLGLAIIGRSPFLMVLPAAGYLFLRKGIDKNAIAYFFFASIIPAFVFYVWKGLVPPDVQHIQSGIQPLFLTYTFAYTAIFIFILYPGWYKVPTFYYKGLAALLVFLFLLNFFFFHIEFVPMKSLNSLIERHTSTSFGHAVASLMPCIMWTLCALHLVALGLHMYNNKANAWRIFLLLAATFIAITTLKSAAQFSTRYPYQSLPFLLIFCAPYIKFNLGLVLRVSAGITLGIISLLGYYHLHYT